MKRDVRRLLVFNEKEYGCGKRVEKEKIAGIVERVVWAQLRRAVGGHESEMSRDNMHEGRSRQDIYHHGAKKRFLPKLSGGSNTPDYNYSQGGMAPEYQ